MSDDHDLDFDQGALRDSFESFRGNYLTAVTPPGTAAARRTLRHRHRVRVVVGGGAAALLVVVGGGAALAATRHQRHTTPVPATSRTSRPSPHQATPGPRVHTWHSSSAHPSSRIAPDELRNGVLDIPSFGTAQCPSGRLQFHDGAHQGNGSMTVWVLTNYTAASADQKSVYQDVDHDGVDEIIASVVCGNDGGEQVLAFDRAADGNISAPRTVVARRNQGADSHYALHTVRAASGGQVQVQWFRSGQNTSSTQWRTYGWNGSGFNQTGGPTGFVPRMDELRDATLNVPAWGAGHCPSGNLHFTGGRSPVVDIDVPPGSTSVDILDNPAEGDAGGTPVRLVKLLCRTYDVQVVAFGLDSNGQVRTVGQVASSQRENDDPNPVSISSVSASGATVTLTWTEVRTPNPRSQQRTYQWSGSGFQQTGGPTHF